MLEDLHVGTVLPVRDIERAKSFYEEALGLAGADMGALRIAWVHRSRRQHLLGLRGFEWPGGPAPEPIMLGGERFALS